MKKTISVVVVLGAFLAAGTANAGSYSGPHADWVSKLLSRSGSWSCPSKAPKVKADACARDTSVAAAVMYAWAAECYAQRGEKSRAAAHAEQMYENLQSANSLCSNAPSVGGGSCDTERIFDCGEM
jgi:hypothetical protein